ncbi:MAG: L,D-transpeptidase, partial [Planctomycetota bacterium]
SKLVNPRWTNPRTGEHFEADDPENPIGEHWIGLQGLGESAVWEGYGIHGTTDPGSIGEDRSMGCVRLGHEDVAFVYELLVDGVSVVVIED